MTDPYSKLRPEAPPSQEEVCACAGNPPIKLMAALGPNPVHCMVCHGEVTPKSLDLPLDLADKLAAWNTVGNALLRLWLDSAEYESWAQGELDNPMSSANRRGLELRADLDRIRRSYYWINIKGDPPACPVCGSILKSFGRDRIGQLVCEKCSIVGAVNNSEGAA